MTHGRVALLRVRVRSGARLLSPRRRQLPPADAGSLVAAEIMGGIYFGILRASRRRDYDVFTRAFACRGRSAR